ncbi:hypothetical protein NH8B_0962 [Pseudogulbenkiania sp. NH8B]|uniref:hypothetical protein n=1 Tax=Pseudogulbenkiania sp. (strain NH8B) TaxID=748280 RepID=UPI0002279A80|nr:hypothetical protein [Pseudogulbenkiania sp. NH8B]BAK75794.1 hypothetical protein NH8B_0962 [Pseudogulbenkiania sp. NH8B]
MRQNQQHPQSCPPTIQQQSISNALHNLDTMEQRILAMISRMRADLTSLYDQLQQN